MTAWKMKETIFLFSIGFLLNIRKVEVQECKGYKNASAMAQLR